MERPHPPDLLVTGYGMLKLFHNEAGTAGGRRFVDVTRKVGLDDNLWSTGAGWADLNGDGFPDLYVCHYVDWSFDNNPPCDGNTVHVKRDICSPSRFKPQIHALFLNNEGKKFRNGTADWGLKAACGLGVILADLNDDGKPDIYVANDTNPNFLFWNRGGRLEEKGLYCGVALNEVGNPDGSMGVDVGDFDGSGRASIWVTNFDMDIHALYQNLGNEAFLHQSIAAGTAAIGRRFVGFGTGFIDVENDGWLDIIIAHGHVFRHSNSGSPKQSAVLMGNGLSHGRRFFSDISARGGRYFQSPKVGRGLAIGDLDNDGWSDVVVSHNNGPMAILRNDGNTLSKNHWVGFKLVGRKHRDVVGSTVVVQIKDRRLMGFAKGGGSYFSANDPRILIGLGTATQIEQITVKWSWGETQTWRGLEPDSYWELREGEMSCKKLNYSARGKE